MIRAFLLVLLLIGCAAPGVIGVAYNQYGIVRYVFKNSPAAKAGVLTGDVIVNYGELRGKIGSQCLVKIVRGKTYFEKLIERIDIDKLERAEW